MVHYPRIKLKICHCLRCDHHWVARISSPAVCPNCHSPYWKTKAKPKKQKVANNTIPPNYCIKCGSLNLTKHANGKVCLQCGKIIYIEESHTYEVT